MARVERGGFGRLSAQADTPWRSRVRDDHAPILAIGGTERRCAEGGHRRSPLRNRHSAL